MDRDCPKRIGLALSGGGVRATAFHLGVLSRLAAGTHLESVVHLSTVSGGSLAAGLVIALAGMRWPSSHEYLQVVLPAARKRLVSHSLEMAYGLRLVGKAWRLRRGRAGILAEALSSLWGITASLQDLPSSPRWVANCTTFETGKRWSFSKKWMGDYQAGYVLEPDFPIAEVMAASAGFPGLIGPLVIYPRQFRWHKLYFQDGADDPYRTEPIEPHFKRMFLWDGGVYENLGMEGLYRPNHGYRHALDFVIVSDASAPLYEETRRFRFGLPWNMYTPPGRLLNVAADQIRALRARQFMAHVRAHPQTGAYLRIGNSNAKIVAEVRRLLTEPAPDLDNVAQGADDQSRSEAACAFPTRLCRLTEAQFEAIWRHGYEVANTTLLGYCRAKFPNQPCGLTW